MNTENIPNIDAEEDMKLKKKAQEPDATNAEPAQEEAPQAEDTQKHLDAAQKLTEEYLNMAQRVQADFDNFRRRNQNVRSEAFEDGAKEVIKQLLPVIDNLERALAIETSDPALHQGVEMVYRGLMEALQKRGVSVIDRKGEPFDPNLENAVLQGTDEEGEPGSVCEVFQKGYKLNDCVLRHAMVKVVAG